MRTETRKPHRLLLVFTLLILLCGVLVGCATNSGQNNVMELDMASLAEMPQEVQDAPAVVQQAYQFAAANPELMSQIPCYCGCGAMGHTSNYSCYVAGENPDGTLSYDPHALGCSICVDITEDSMRLLKQGKSVSEIRSYVDETYSRFGPSNMP
jgi:hypothetical protein